MPSNEKAGILLRKGCASGRSLGFMGIGGGMGGGSAGGSMAAGRAGRGGGACNAGA